MSRLTFFLQDCPTCGRRLQVRVEHLGREVVCQHCSGRFIASDHAPGRQTTRESVDALMRRADEFLHKASRKPAESRILYPR